MKTAILSFLLFFSLASANKLAVKQCGEDHIENKYGFVVYSCSATRIPRFNKLKQPKQLKKKKYGKIH